MKAARALRRLLRAVAATSRDLFHLAMNGHVLTVSAYLLGRGCEAEFVERYKSAFGRQAAKAHRAATGAEPVKGWSVVRDKVREVFVYVGTGALDAAWDAYPRTRSLAG